MRSSGADAGESDPVFPGGYHVRTGNQTNPTYSVSDGACSGFVGALR